MSTSTPPAAIAMPAIHLEPEPTGVTTTATAAVSDAPLPPPSQPVAHATAQDAKHEHENEDDHGDLEREKLAAPNPTTSAAPPSYCNDEPTWTPPSRFQSFLSDAGECLFVAVFILVALTVDLMDKLRGRPRRNHWQ